MSLAARFLILAILFMSAGYGLAVLAQAPWRSANGCAYDEADVIVWSTVEENTDTQPNTFKSHCIKRGHSFAVTAEVIPGPERIVEKEVLVPTDVPGPERIVIKEAPGHEIEVPVLVREHASDAECLNRAELKWIERSCPASSPSPSSPP